MAATVQSSGIGSASRYVPVGIGLYAGWNGESFSTKALQAQVKTVQQQGYGYCVFTWEYIFLRHLVNFVQ